MLLDEKDYRSILKKEYQDRFRRNSRYTLRAFARDLELSSGRLSDVLNSKKGLSRASAEKIAGKLGYTSAERDVFCDLVDAADARALAQKNLARLRLLEKTSDQKSRQIEVDQFKMISDWYHLAILELLQQDACPEPAEEALTWMAKRLNTPRPKIDQAVERLMRLGLMKQEHGKYVCVASFTETMGEISSQAVKAFHRQMVERALATLYTRPIDERLFNSSVLSIDKQQWHEAQQDIVRFRMEFTRKYGSTAKRDAVYGLALQFFPLEEPVEPASATARMQESTETQ